MQSDACLHRSRRAFSLIEVVLAIGIIAFALVAIIGMFPVALKSATESQRETQAAFIARGILVGLNSERPYIVEKGSLEDGMRVPVDVRAPSRRTLNFDEGGMIVPANEPSRLSSGIAVYEAEIRVDPDTPETGISRLQVTVAVPPAAPSSQRQRYEFVTYLSTAQLEVIPPTP